MAPDTSTEENDIDWFALLQVLADNLRLLVLAPLVIGLFALAYTYTLSPSYNAITKFLPPSNNKARPLLSCKVWGLWRALPLSPA